jgi:hypothetical protein
MDIGLSRRAILRSTRGAVAVLATGGTLFAAETGTRALPGGDAYQPWKSWDDPSLKGTPFALVSAAVLAANPHDTQPWLFRVADDSIDVYADASRNLGAMDPFLREMHLGLGCAIENMILAAPPNGYSVQVDLAPGALTDIPERVRPILAARLRLTTPTSKAVDAVHRAIPERHTNRYAYERSRPLDPAWLEAARRIGEGDGVRVIVFPEGAMRDRLEAAMVEATKAIIADARMIADSDRWFRGSRADIDAHRDGPTLEAAGLSFLALTYARLFPVSAETSHTAWLSQTRDVQLGTATTLGLIAVSDRYDRAQSIAAGRCWQRLHLDATLSGVALQPVNQPIERIDRDRQTGGNDEFARRIAELTGAGWQATFAFRAGYCDRQGVASPRRRLADVILGQRKQ